MQGSYLAFGDQWEWAVPPLEKAELSRDGSVRRKGWTQHREVPFFNNQTRTYNQPDESNLVQGQNPDITPNFPWDVWFEVLATEMIRFRTEGGL